MSAELLKEADVLFDQRQFDHARAAYARITNDAEASLSDQTEAYAMIARTYLITERKEEGRPWLEQAARQATTELPLGCSRYLGVKGRFEWKDGRTADALNTFQTMYDFCHAHKLHERAIDAAHMMAILVPAAEQVAWAQRGIKEAEAGTVTRWLGPLWNNLGATYEELGRFQESLDAYLKAREYHWQYGSEMNKLKADWAVGHAYRLMGDQEKAKSWLNPVLAWCARLGEQEFLGWSYYELGKVATAAGDNTTAYRLLTQARDTLRAVGMEEWDAAEIEKITSEITQLQMHPKS